MLDPSDRGMQRVFAWTVFTLAFPWLALVKSLLRSDHRWGFFGLTGTGTGGDFWALAALVGLGGLFLATAWWGPRHGFQGWVLCWHLALFALMVYGAATFGREMTLEAGAFGIVLPLWWIGPLLFGWIAFATVRWVVNDLRRPQGSRRPPGSGSLPARRSLDRRALLVALALAPVIVVCFRYGVAIDGALAKLGVVATVAQWLAIAGFVRVVPGEARQEPAGHRAQAAAAANVG